MIQQQVKPYVDNDIRNDWLAAMGSASASVEASYDEAIHALASTSEVRFDVPGDFGPSWPVVFDKPPDSSPAAATVPTMALPADTGADRARCGAGSRPPTSPQPQGFRRTALDDAASMPAELAAPLGDAAGLSGGAGDLGSVGGLAGSIGGVVGKIVDGIGGLLGSLADGFSDPSGSEDPLLDDPLDDDDPLGNDADTADEDLTDDDADDTGQRRMPNRRAAKAPSTEAPVENPSATSDPVDEPVAQQITPAPDAAAPPPAASPGPAEPQPDGSTPCEIAEDQLPQAGQ